MMRFLFVIPPNYTARFSYPNLGIMYIAAVLRDDGHDVRVLDCQHEKTPASAMLRAAQGMDYAGFYVNVFSFDFVKNCIEMIKDSMPSRPVILAGGPLASYRAEYFAREYSDITVVGEGEETIREIASGKPLADIRSIVYDAGGGNIISTDARPGRVDPESIPFPKWEMVDYRKYGYTIVKKRPLVSMMTSRGCPNKCIYCSKLIHGYKLRNRSVENVIAEIERADSAYGIKEIHFLDDNITADTLRFKRICAELASKGLNRRLVFGNPSGIRPDIGDREMFTAMKKAGFYFTVISVESADEGVSEKLGRGVDLSLVKGNIAEARRAGLIVSTFYIFGAPFDTRETIRKTTEFAWASDANIMSVFYFLPFPGTKLHERLVAEGKIPPEEEGDISGISYISMKPRYEANDWSADDLIRLTKKAYMGFHLSPKRVMHNLAVLPGAFFNPFVLLLMLLRLIFKGTPVFEKRIAGGNGKRGL